MEVIKSPKTTPVPECGDDLLLQAMLFETATELESLKTAFRVAAQDPDRVGWLIVAYRILYIRYALPKGNPARLDFPATTSVIADLNLIVRDGGGSSPEYLRARGLAADVSTSGDAIAATLGASVDSWLTWAVMSDITTAAVWGRIGRDVGYSFSKQGRLTGDWMVRLAKIREEWSAAPPTADPLLRELLHHRVDVDEAPRARASTDYLEAKRAFAAAASQAEATTCWAGIAARIDSQSPNPEAAASTIRALFDRPLPPEGKGQKKQFQQQKQAMWVALRETNYARFGGPYWWDAAESRAVVGDDKGDWWQLPASDVRCDFHFFRLSSREAFGYFGEHQGAVRIAPSAQRMPAVWAGGEALGAYGREGEYSPDDLVVVGVGGADDYGVALWRERRTNDVVGWSKAYSVGEVQRTIAAGMPIVIRDNLPEVAELDGEMRRMLRHELTL